MKQIMPPSEGRGHRFESCRARQSNQRLMQIARKRARTELTINSPPKSVCRAYDRPQRRRSRRQRRARARPTVDVRPTFPIEGHADTWRRWFASGPAQPPLAEDGLRRRELTRIRLVPLHGDFDGLSERTDLHLPAAPQ